MKTKLNFNSINVVKEIKLDKIKYFPKENEDRRD